jgi:hypothetical protein
MCLNQLNQESPIQEYVAIDSGNAKIGSNEINGNISNNSLSNKATNLPNVLRLKPQCKVILLKNYNVLRGWVNGAFCTVIKLKHDKILVKKYFTPRCSRRTCV